MSRPAGIMSRSYTRSEDAKLKAVRKVVRLLEDGYSLTRSARLAGVSRNHVQGWAAEFGIAWPKKQGGRP